LAGHALLWKGVYRACLEDHLTIRDDGLQALMMQVGTSGSGRGGGWVKGMGVELRHGGFGRFLRCVAA
jgi:hypothetical protein